MDPGLRRGDGVRPRLESIGQILLTIGMSVLRLSRFLILAELLWPKCNETRSRLFVQEKQLKRELLEVLLAEPRCVLQRFSDSV